MLARTLMFQGTASHVGKSVLTAAFCRILRQQGIRVAPFKAVNMSNNAWVTREGGEMAVAQASQAWACGLEPTVEMNPVLLKTLSDRKCQIILRGRPLEVAEAIDLKKYRDLLEKAIRDSLEKLRESYEFVVIEGAGSPAEINLRRTDWVNMPVARAAEAPVVLIGDIERGGVFAQLVGTLELLEPEDRERVKGFLINKFRGDLAILQPGLSWLEQRTALPVFGVLPFLEDLSVPEEDGLADRFQKAPSNGAHSAGALRVEVVRYPTISNFTDFDPLHREPGVEIRYLHEPPRGGEEAPHLLILPGSKSTMADLTWLRRVGLDRYVTECLQKGAEILGICGGFQMMGERIYDPSHVESAISDMAGLGLMPTGTLFLSSKVTAQVKGTDLESGHPIRGYEIHAGRPQGLRRGKPVFRIQERGGAAVDDWDGCRLPDKPVWGTYLHGLFEEELFRRHFLRRLRSRYDLPVPEGESTPAASDPYDRLAEQVRKHVEVGKILDRVSGGAGWTSSLSV